MRYSSCAMNGYQRESHELARRKRKRLEKKVSNSKNNLNQVHALESKLALTCYEIKEAYLENLDREEQKAVSGVKLNPKQFYRYAKSHSTMKSGIAMLRTSEGIWLNDHKLIADAFQDQFSSVYSDPDAKNIKSPDFNVRVPNVDMSDISLSFTDGAILNAIGELNLNSAPGPDGLPAQLIKNCSNTIVVPLGLMWRESFRRGEVPKFYKTSHVCPIHKKGDRVTAENYRPVSLTSHVIKIFERILRKAMASFCELNNVLSINQHGFRSGKSTLTQLFVHSDEIVGGLREDPYILTTQNRLMKLTTDCF